MAAGSMAPLDHHDVGVAVLDQRVDERHPERAGTDDEIVGLEPRVARHARQSSRIEAGPIGWTRTTVLPLLLIVKRLRVPLGLSTRKR